MKISSAIGLVLLVSLVFVSWEILILDFETNYIDTGVSDATRMNETFKGRFNNASDMNRTLSPLIEGFKNIQDTDRGWFDKLGDLVIAIPTAIISFPSLILNSFAIIATGTTEFATMIGIPIEIILIGIIGLLLFGLFKLVEFWRRTPV